MRIVILGGGPAGLAVARLLFMRGMGATVLERNASPESVGQGGTLDLGIDGGQRAIREMGLEKPFQEVARPHGQSFRVLDSAARIQLDLSPSDFASPRPEIDRVQLRQILLDSLPARTVQWGKRAVDVVPLRAGQHRILIEDGEFIDADLVVGCDGIGSAARGLVTDVQPSYCGITFIQGHIASPDRDSFVARMVGDGAMFAIGDNKFISGQRNSDGSIRIYLAIRVAQDRTRGQGDAFSDAATVQAQLLRIFHNWHPDLLEVLGQTDGDYSYWPLYTMPAHQQWVPHRGLTLVGDAAHVMPPFTGEGVNMALVDAVDLVDALCDSRYGCVDDAVAAYESTMLARMGDAITAANAGGDQLLNPDGPTSLLAQFR